MTTKYSAYSLALSLLLTSACTQLQQKPDDYWLKKPTQAKPAARAAALLQYANYVNSLTEIAYSRELNHARQLADKEKTPYRQLQYALALAAPGGDRRKAEQVLDGVTKKGAMVDAELAALAKLIATDLATRRRLEACNDSNGELESKLEAVKNIEKNMINRSRK